jgi:hypothetical protein
MLRAKKKEIQKKTCNNKRAGVRKKSKDSVMKLSQICGRIELCMREIILRFEMNL